MNEFSTWEAIVTGQGALCITSILANIAQWRRAQQREKAMDDHARELRDLIVDFATANQVKKRPGQSG